MNERRIYAMNKTTNHCFNLKCISIYLLYSSNALLIFQHYRDLVIPTKLNAPWPLWYWLWGRLVWLFAIALYVKQNKIHIVVTNIKLSCCRLYFGLTEQRFQSVVIDLIFLIYAIEKPTIRNLYLWTETIFIGNVGNLQFQTKNWC